MASQCNQPASPRCGRTQAAWRRIASSASGATPARNGICAAFQERHRALPRRPLCAPLRPARGCRPATSRIRQPGCTSAANRAGPRAADWPTDACGHPSRPGMSPPFPAIISRITRTSRSLLVSKLPPVPSMSSQGEIGIVAAGSGSPCSRARRSVVTARPPPAESPVNAICPGLIP